MSKNDLFFRIDDYNYNQFKANMKYRNFRKYTDYFYFLIELDNSQLNDEKRIPDKINEYISNLKFEIRDLECPHEPQASENNITRNNVRLFTDFDLILKLLFKILSLQIEPYPYGSSELILDEQRIGEDKAKEIIFEDLAGLNFNDEE